MWQVNSESLDDGRIYKITLLREATPLQFFDVIEGWVSDDAFRCFFNQLLADAPFKAFFWETPPVTQSTRNRLFECVIVDSPALVGVHTDSNAFAEHFECVDADEEVVGFSNLGHDVFLVAPCPMGVLDLYPHLATFVRDGPATQQQVFWQRVGAAMTERLSDQPLWLSTSGMGVYWLHVRLDSYPKYYTYHPYTQFDK